MEDKKVLKDELLERVTGGSGQQDCVDAESHGRAEYRTNVRGVCNAVYDYYPVCIFQHFVQSPGFRPDHCAEDTSGHRETGQFL